MENEQTPVAATPETEEFKLRKIRSFVLRQGHLSTGQARALEEFGPQFCIDYSPNVLDLDAAFGRS
ncbi:MAG: tRNA (guanosine(46)-N7)-methyltransferase TrmB, partial [Deefgea sp.]